MTRFANKSSQNTQSKSFDRQAVKLVRNREYLASDFDSARFFSVPHPEAIKRLNLTMNRLRRGNSTIYYTMLFKDQPRQELIQKFWNTVVSSKEFKELPDELKALELEQAKKVGPKSRFTEAKLWKDFTGHIDPSVKKVNKRISDYQDAADAVLEYWTILGKQALAEDPSLTRYINVESIRERLLQAMPKDKSGGYDKFINVDVQIAGVQANVLYYKDYEKWKSQQHKQMLLEEFCRVQAKGNTMFDELKGFQPFAEVGKFNNNDDVWQEEKNRCVQGDSRSMQFPYKPISDILTRVVKQKDVNLLGWESFEIRNVRMSKFMHEFAGKYDWDSFDAAGYDWSTDPENQKIGVRTMFKLAQNLGLDTNAFIDEDVAIRHYSYDPTITTRGIYERAGSTGSGENLTGPNGTVQNYIRCWLQTADLFGVTPKALIPIMLDYNNRGVPLFSCVGDDAFQLRRKGITSEEIAESNLILGFDNNVLKILKSSKFIHFLQVGYYYDPETGIEFLSYGPVTRGLENLLFQETANEKASSTDMSTSAIQSLTITRYNPLQYLLVEFAVEGDPKWRLGAKDPAGFIKAVNKNKTVAEAIHREWDPTYDNMTWEQYAEANQATFKSIARAAEKFPKPTGQI